MITLAQIKLPLTLRFTQSHQCFYFLLTWTTVQLIETCTFIQNVKTRGHYPILVSSLVVSVRTDFEI